MNSLISEKLIAKEQPPVVPFSTERWLKYFEENRELQSSISLPGKISLEPSLSIPLIRSLQRFQIGETGDGRHLKKNAGKVADPAYLQCIDLFIKEEQSHGQILGEIIRAMDGSLISWHWSDFVFICLRRMFGLKTEIFILLIAELIGKCFYKTVADNVEDDLMSNAFAIIVCDEIAHLRFHAEFLQQRMAKYSWSQKSIVHYAWSLIFYSACFVFVLDHKSALKALGVSSADFTSSCSHEFQRTARWVFNSFIRSGDRR